MVVGSPVWAGWVVGNGLAPDKEKPKREREGLDCKTWEGSGQLSRESPISNPFPEELTKDFKGNHPSLARRGGKNAGPGAAITLIITGPHLRAGFKRLRHRPLTAQLWTFPQGLTRGISLVALRAVS